MRDTRTTRTHKTSLRRMSCWPHHACDPTGERCQYPSQQANLSSVVISCTPPCGSLRVSVVGNRIRERPMPSLIPDFATLETRLAGLPVVKHRAREVVLIAGSRTGELL